MPTYVLNDGTYNVEEFQSGANKAVVGLEMYGTQEVKAKLLFEPREVTSDNAHLEIKRWRYEAPFINAMMSRERSESAPSICSVLVLHLLFCRFNESSEGFILFAFVQI